MSKLTASKLRNGQEFQFESGDHICNVRYNPDTRNFIVYLNGSTIHASRTFESMAAKLIRVITTYKLTYSCI